MLLTYYYLKKKKKTKTKTKQNVYFFVVYFYNKMDLKKKNYVYTCILLSDAHEVVLVMMEAFILRISYKYGIVL